MLPLFINYIYNFFINGVVNRANHSKRNSNYFTNIVNSNYFNYISIGILSVIGNFCYYYYPFYNQADVVHWPFIVNNVMFNESVDKIVVTDGKVADIYVNMTKKYKLIVPIYNFIEKESKAYKDFSIPIFHEYSFNYINFFNHLTIVMLVSSIVYNYASSLDTFGNIGSAPSNDKITLSDIVNTDNTVEEVMELIDALIKPKKYIDIGAKTPKGILMVGAPGTGKTLLARAVANSVDGKFIYISAPEFNAMFVGLGGIKARKLFESARKSKPTIIFIDEIDSIGKKRGENYVSSVGNDDRESTLNQILTEMDGFNTSDGIIVIGATNRYDVLDKALLRPGRFDRIVRFELPTLNDRKKLALHYLNKIKTDDNVEAMASAVAIRTRGRSHADICNIINESAIFAVRKGLEMSNMNCIEMACDYIIIGSQKKNTSIQKETERIAYHEVGHALMSILVESDSYPLKISIIPHKGGVLGFSQSLSNEDKNIYTQTELEQKIMVLLGGRCAENLIYDDYSTGAHDDLEKANSIVYQLITKYGMSDRLGCRTTYIDEKTKSEYYLRKVDEELIKIMSKLEAKTQALLKLNIETLKKIALILMDKEVIYYEEIKGIYDNDKKLIK